MSETLPQKYMLHVRILLTADLFRQSPSVSGNSYLLRKANQLRSNPEDPSYQSQQPLSPDFLTFVVLPGNNSGLIKDAMLRRSHKWKESSSQSD